MEETVKKEEGCSECKNKGLKMSDWIFIGLGIYVFASSIYGTIQIIKNFF